MKRVPQTILPVVLLLILMASALPASARQRASNLYPASGILRVGISPDGDWVVATAVNGETFGLFAQRFGSAKVETIASSRAEALSIDWVGHDTLIASFGDQRFLRVKFRRAEDGGFGFDKRWFSPPGYLVDSLPLVNGVLLWGLDRGDRNSVHRVTLDDVVNLHKSARISRKRFGLGDVVASIEGVTHGWVVDRAGIPVVAIRRDENGYTVFYRSGPHEDLQQIASYEDEDENFVWPYALTSDGLNLLVTAYNGRETLGLFVFDPRSRKIVKEIYSRDDADLIDVVLDPITGDVLSVAYELGGETRHHYLEETRALYADKLGPESPEIDDRRVVGSTAGRRRFVYRTSNATEPGAHYLRSTDTDETRLIGQWGAEINRNMLAGTESFKVTSQDGTVLEAFLTRPRTAPTRPAPLLVMPHGGPIGVRDRQQYDPMVQYFASWGFATLQANYRGSSGYGRRFKEAGRKQWAQGIEDDIDAAVEYAMALPEIDEDNVCIIGGSYGGFSAIVSVLRHADRYRCAATINGVSDIPLMGESSDFADSARVLAVFEKNVGDLESDRDKLLAISPAYHLEEVATPILVVYGDEDRRVDPDHAFRVTMMLKLYGKEYEEIRVKGGAHSFTRYQWLGVLPEIRKFLTKHLMPNVSFERDPR